MALNTRQQKYKKNRLAGMNCYNAARAAGYSQNVASKHIARLEESVGIKDLFDRMGLTDTVLIEKHSQLLGAKKVVGYLHQYKKGEEGGPIEKLKPEEVISNEFLEVDDFPTQLKALELSYKVKGHLRDTAPTLPATNVNSIIQIFQTVRKEEAVAIDRGTDALDVLFGADFVKQIKDNNGNGHASA